MRWGPRAITALSALAYAVGAACGGGGSSTVTITALGSGFPQGFLPVLLPLPLAGGSGDVTFRADGDLYAVAGKRDVTVVSRSDGHVSTFASNVGGGSTELRSVVVGPDGRLFAGDDDGMIWAIAADGTSSTLLEDTLTGAPITGMAIAPTGFGELAGSIIAAAGASGILAITTGELPATSELVPPGQSYVDVAFSGTTLFALDATSAEIDTVSATPGVAPTSFQGGFDNPVGIAVDDGRSEILVADAGTDVLRALPVSGGTPTDRAPYDFDPSAPSGIAYDGVGAIAFVASGTIYGSAVPRIDPANPNFGLIFNGPTVGYGDLEFDRNGEFILVANDESTPNNFLFRVPRDGSTVTTLASGIGAAAADEALLSLAIDPAEETIFIGTSLGNVYQRDSDGNVTLLVDPETLATDPILGLELAPADFGAFVVKGDLIATTSKGKVLSIDPLNPTPPTPIATIAATSTCGLSPCPARLSDLVFASDGSVLYVLDNGASEVPGDPRILVGASNGTFTPLAGVDSAELGRPDGIEIDEGGNRLLVTMSTDAGDQLLEVPLEDPADVTPLANIVIDDAFFPTGIVCDRLGTAILRTGDGFTALDAVSVFP